MNSTLDLLAILAGRVLQMAYAALAVRVLTSVLPPNEVGRNYILTSLPLVFNWVFLNPVSQYMGVKLLEWIHGGSARSNHLQFAKYTIGVLVGVSAVSLLLLWTVGVGTEITAPWLLWLIVGSLLIGMTNFICTNGLNILGHRVLFVLFTNLAAWFGLLLSMLLAVRISALAEFWLSGQLLGQAAVLIPAALLFWKYLSPATEETAIVSEAFKGLDPRAVFRFSWPMSIVIGLGWIQWQSYRFILQNIYGESVVGLFAATYAVAATLVSAYEVLFSQFYVPILYKDIAGQDSYGRAEAWNRYAEIFIPSILVTVAFVAAGGPFLAKLMLDSRYYLAAVTVVPIAALAEGARVIGSVYQMAAFVQLDMQKVMWPTLVGVSLTIVGVLVMSRWDPLVGTGLALFLGAIVTAILLSIKLHQTFSLRLPSKRLLWSLLTCLPFIGILLSTWLLQPSLTIVGAFFPLTIMGVYFLVSQFVLTQSSAIPLGVGMKKGHVFDIGRNAVDTGYPGFWSRRKRGGK